MINPVDRYRFAAWAEIQAIVDQMRPGCRDEMMFVLDDADRCTALAYAFIDYRREVGPEGSSQRVKASDMRDALGAMGQMEQQFRTIRNVLSKLNRLQIPAENQGRADLYEPLAELETMALEMEKYLISMRLPRMMTTLKDVASALPEGSRLGPGDALRGSARNRFVLDVAYTFDQLRLELLPKGTFGEFISRCIDAAEGQGDEHCKQTKALKTSALYDLVKRARAAVDNLSPVIEPTKVSLK